MTRSPSQHNFVLALHCPDRPGIVHAVTGFLLRAGGNIVQSQQYGDAETGSFFMRVHVELTEGSATVQELRAAFAPTGEQFAMTWDLWDHAARYNTLIMVSRAGHCLNDLLFRWSTGALQIDIPAIVSNHRDLEGLADSYGIPFHHVAVTPKTKTEAEQRLMELVTELDVHLVVLARYMQVLSDDICRALRGRAINIHHSFLPSFKGASPYHQAHQRGVKLIGATAHYVTADLDEGPIIEQDVTRVSHDFTPAQLVSAGRDVESQVLSRAVRWHCETRVMLNGSKTVVLR
ncbi:MAG: formyltetrahydrofolate deformylase [Propionibacteriales bacterium]|jgi:formyltetrahydrofolate deformylase|nr:formyltetrahydrofolate deformylase [Propionibacteriales bacterium]